MRMINTIPQAGTKPVGPRLAGLSASFDVIRRLAFGFSWISNKNLCTIWMSSIVQGHAPWTAPQPSQPYPYLLCPWVALFHIFLYIYLDNLAPSLRPQSVARAQSLVFQGPPSRVVAFPSRESQGQATRTTSYLGEPQTNAGRLYTVFPIVQISASFIAIHIIQRCLPFLFSSLDRSRPDEQLMCSVRVSLPQYPTIHTSLETHSTTRESPGCVLFMHFPNIFLF